MISIELPLGPSLALVPIADERIMKSPTPSVELNQFGRISVAIPASSLLDRAMLKDDPDAIAFMESSHNYSFHLLNLACTFVDSTKDRFDEAWVRVSLETPTGTETAIAWSMRPLRETDLVENSYTFKLEPSLKFMTGEESGLALEVGRKDAHEAAFVTGYNLMQNTPYWHFRRTSMRTIDGSYGLALVVRSHRRARVQGTLSVKAQVRKTVAWFIRESRELADPPRPLTFALS
jgi:hypothetical protein